jgi:hypothetical protein
MIELNTETLPSAPVLQNSSPSASDLASKQRRLSGLISSLLFTRQDVNVILLKG